MESVLDRSKRAAFALFLTCASELAAETFPVTPAASYDQAGRFPAGTIERNISYYSTVAGRNLVMHVYTPPGYSNSQRYGVVYCYQGIGDGPQHIFMDTYIRAHIVADNLLGEGKIAPVIIIALDDQFNGNSSDVAGMTIKDAIPFVDGRYSTYADADHRGVYGYSWGGGYAFNVGCENLDVFHHVAPTAAAPNKSGDTTLFPNGGAAAKQKLKSLFFSWGGADYGSIIAANRATRDYCVSNGIPHLAWEIAGGGHWSDPVWRPAFWNFLQIADEAGISAAEGANPPVISANQTFSVTQGASTGANVGYVQALDLDGSGTLHDWQITGGTGSTIFAVNAATGQVTLTNPSALNASATPNYTLTLVVSDGGDTSAAGTVVVNVLAPGTASTRLVNLSVRTRAGKDDKTLVMGFVVEGTASKSVLVRGLGPTLLSYGVTDALPDPIVRLYGSSGQIDSNDDWGGASSLTDAFARLGAAPLNASSKDSALLRATTPGVYSAHVTALSAATGIALAETYDGDKSGARFINVSARSEARIGDDILIAGFVLEGVGSKTLLIRGLGPTLGALGVGGALADPQLKLFNSAGAKFAENGDWGGTEALKNAFTTLGATALTSDSSKDAALLVTLPPGAYSAQVSGVNNTSGVALVEVYEVP